MGAIGVASQHSTSIIEVNLEWHFDKGALVCVSLPKSFKIKETTGLSLCHSGQSLTNTTITDVSS